MFMRTKLFNIKFTVTLLMLAFIFLFENCKRKDECEGVLGPPPNSTHFDSLELSKIPDWKGDSLFFYSDAGDTAYMYCYDQSPPNNYESESYINPLPCNYTSYSYYPYQAYYYRSNEPTLNGLYVEFYKEAIGYQWGPGPPVSRVLIPKLDGFTLNEFGFNVTPNDSVKLEDGSISFGWKNRDAATTMNLKFGFLKINFQKSLVKWTIYKYKLKN